MHTRVDGHLGTPTTLGHLQVFRDGSMNMLRKLDAQIEPATKCAAKGLRTIKARASSAGSLARMPRDHYLVLVVPLYGACISTDSVGGNLNAA